jgi:pimeloyl-ACP methyl ester carboxylesterase
MLPALGTTSQVWEANIAILSEHFHTFAPDLIGDFGRSVATSRISCSDHLVGWLLELLEELGLKGTVRLLGFSYGGWIAANFAFRCPARVERLVLVAPAATVMPISLGFRLRAFLLLTRRWHPVKMFCEWLFEDSAMSATPSHRRAIDELSRLVFVGLRCFRSIQVITPTVLSNSAFRNWKVPTYFLIGEHEKMYSPQQVIRRLNELAPAIKTETIYGTGHDILALAADLASHKILDFLC